MTRFITFALYLLPFLCASQVSFSSWANGYMQINSYNGNSNSDAYNVTFAANGNLNVPHWKLSAKLKQSIVSPDGKYTIPANKISFQPISTTGQSYPNPIPSIAQIGAPQNVYLQENGESYLIPDANAPLYNQPSQPGGYYNLQLKYGITVLGGAYLGKFPSWTTFTAAIEFTAYDQYNAVIGKMTHTYQFQIGSITDAPPAAEELSLKVNTNAANGILEFKTLQDYSNGTSVTYSNGLLVNSNSNFQIKVRSLQNEMRSPSGNTIPVDVVHLTLMATTTTNPNQQIFPIVLSSSSQIIAQANSNTKIDYRYDIRYFTKPQDVRLINAKSDSYATTLQYEITPQ